MLRIKLRAEVVAEKQEAATQAGPFDKTKDIPMEAGLEKLRRSEHDRVVG